jgi:hypothetical protein
MHFRLALLTTLLLGLVTAAPAAADTTTTSSNWSGYAVHGPSVSFSHATGTWTVPHVDCTAAAPGYSAAWVGIGGYALTAPALEQVGTETDCTHSGRVVDTAWYEVVPSPSHPLRLTVHPGDSVTATVAVSGHRVVLTLLDRTRHRSASKTLTAGTVDRGSAEWIVEAPERCVSATNCQTLPLADFGAVSFSGARATEASGQGGSIASPRWTRTKITLAQGGSDFISGSQELTGAVPGALSASGAGFRVLYATQAIAAPGVPTRMGTRAGAQPRPQPGDRRR